MTRSLFVALLYDVCHGLMYDLHDICRTPIMQLMIFIFNGNINQMVLTWSALICIMHKIGNCLTAGPLMCRTWPTMRPLLTWFNFN